MDKYRLAAVAVFAVIALIGFLFFFGVKLPKIEGEPSPSPSSLSPTETPSPVASPSPTTPEVSISNTSTPLPVINLKNHMHTITLKTNFGDITFETYDADAPKTVANFIKLAESNFYDNLIFHRVIKNFMIQGGDPNGTGTGGPGYSFADELNPATESGKEGYKRGVVAMANAGPNTNGSQFFIMHADVKLPYNYTIFGKVVSGMDAVDKIANLPTGANDRPVTPPVIKDVTVVKK